MLLHGFIENSTVNGPGERAVVWFQGCNLGCSGCWNPDTHAFDTSKKISTRKFCEEKLAPLPDDLSGVTFSGGDPIQHIEDTLQICWWIKLNKPKWSIGMFTGYTEKEIESAKYQYFDDQNDILVQANSHYSYALRQWYTLKNMLDFAIMGRYNKLASVNNPLVTSSNQELKLFTNRYKPEDFPPQAVEIFVDEDGLVQITGFPVGIDLKEFINEKRERQTAS